VPPTFWIALGVAGIALILLGFLAVAGSAAAKQDFARVSVLFAKGASPENAAEQLVAEGTDPAQAAKMVTAALRRFTAARIGAMLDEGMSAKDVEKVIVGEGIDEESTRDLIGHTMLTRRFRRRPLVSAMGGLILAIIGVAVMLVGLVLRDGNRTGRFVTFPFAGTLTIGLGMIPLCFGCMALYFLFKRPG
jgi:hypothetical protein